MAEHEQTRLVNPGTDWMLFVDGENVAKRGQEAMEQGGISLQAGPYWRRDVFLWLPIDARSPFFSTYGWSPLGMERPIAPNAARAYYYTSTISDEPEWTETRLALRELGFEPRLFKRAQGRSKAVDVALATDVLTLAAEGRYDVAVICAGDGDYVPVIEAVKRFGRHVVVGFFAAHGLNPELRIAADDFIDLTPRFTRAWAEHFESQAREAAAKASAEGTES